MAEPTMTAAAVAAPPHVTRNLKLRCCRCGTRAVYDVGTVLYEPEGEGESAKTHYSFTGYFHCQHCHSAGPWEVDDNLKLLGLRMLSKLSSKSAGLYKGYYALQDGTVLQTPAMAEEHLLQRLQQQPRNVSLHRRLGNVLREAGQAATAAEWYAKALALEPHDLISRYHLFTRALHVNDTPATVLHARLLVRDLLAGRPAPAEEPDAAVILADFLVEDLRAAPDTFRQQFLSAELKRSKRPEDVFIRTLLTQDGEEEDILVDAADRLLAGEPEPSALAGTPVVTGSPAPPKPAPPKPFALDLVPSLAQAVQAEGLDATKLDLAYEVPSAKHIRVDDRHDLFLTDGQKAMVWTAPALADLFRGNKMPPPNLERFPPEYTPHFVFIEAKLLAICDFLGDLTDQEMEEIYAALRRRPDGRSLGVAHDLVWQIMALLLGTRVVSAAEYEGLVNALLGSARRWGLRPISRNYVTYLRRTFGHPPL